MADNEFPRIRVETLVGLLIGLSYGYEIFALVADASDAAAAGSALSAMSFDVPDDLRVVLPALPDTLILSDRQVRAILNNRLNRFTRRERLEYLDELRSLGNARFSARA